jgi:hypothetical protein
VRWGFGSCYSFGVAVGLCGYGMCQMHGVIDGNSSKKCEGSAVLIFTAPVMFFKSPSCPEVVQLSTWEIFVSRMSPVR